MDATRTSDATSSGAIVDVVRRYWGYDRLRPLQEQAIRAGVEHRDSLIVMPTGGGKSLCYQVPPLLANRMDVVVSPLISLMKDQVDGLRECGYPAAALHSGMSTSDIRQAEAEIAAGKYRLIFAAPERLMSPHFLGLLQRVRVRAFAIDEAHCISHWGHDFRKEYRQLAILRERFPGASLHACTATATQRVRDDIIAQLRLRDPAVLVGTFDRPNLVYRVVPRVDVYAQTLDVVRRHKKQAVIVYCISRRDTEEMAEYLRSQRVRAAFYHAGMDADKRRAAQDAFAEEKLDVVVATVAFGMGIDRSDVRCVIHAAMPKSVEHYQQETGRAGRDELEAECVLLYSAGDAMRWERLIEKSAGEPENAGGSDDAAGMLLKHMQRYASAMKCRHKYLSEYFGQEYERPNCGACDVCLEEMEGVADATVTAQKILSCVARVGQRFGIGHVVDVLLGANTERIRSLGHDQLSTFGLLKGCDKKQLINMTYQLVDQGLLARTSGELPIVQLNEDSWAVMRGQRPVQFMQPKRGGVKKTRAAAADWEGVDSELFESLRGLRRELAEQRGVPPFLIFGDATLRDMARFRPGSPAALARISGVGERKLADLGAAFLARIESHCADHKLALDVSAQLPAAAARPVRGGDAKQRAFDLFRKSKPIEEVATALDRARSTTTEYLREFIESSRPASIAPWVDPATYQQVSVAARRLGVDALRPIFEDLKEQVPYDSIKLVATHLRVLGG